MAGVLHVTYFRLVANGYSLRKTFGRQVYNMNSENSELALVKLMELFNNGSVVITKRYFGLRQEETLLTCDCLAFRFLRKENIMLSYLFVKFAAILVIKVLLRYYLSFSNLENLNAVKIIDNKFPHLLFSATLWELDSIT